MHQHGEYTYWVLDGIEQFFALCHTAPVFGSRVISFDVGESMLPLGIRVRHEADVLGGGLSRNWANDGLCHAVIC